jgi:hypothetical protein
MQSIVAPITPNDTGAQVANLIECLLFLVERGLIKAYDPPNQPTKEELDALAASARKELATQTFGEASARLVFYVQLQEGLGDSLKGAVDDKTAQMLNGLLLANGAVFDEIDVWIVKGTVTIATGALPPGLQLEAFDQDLRTEQLLGTSPVDAAGHYQIRYSTAEFWLGDGAPFVPGLKRELQAAPDLFLKVWPKDRHEAPLVRTPTRFKASNLETWDVVLPAPAGKSVSELEHMLARVQPLLIGQKPLAGLPFDALPLTELTLEDVDFIVRETGLDEGHVRLWIEAIALAAQVVLFETSNAASGEAVLFYGWWRDGLPGDLAALLRRSTDDLLGSLRRSVERHIIPALTRIESQLAPAIDKLKAGESLKLAAEGQPASLGDLMAVAVADDREWKERLAKGATEIYRVIATGDMDSPAMLGDLAAVVQDERLARRMVTAVRLGRLAEHTPMVAALMERLGDGESGRREPEAPLASLDRLAWLELAYLHGTLSWRGMAPEDYADYLEAQVEKAAPTATLVQALATQPFYSEKQIDGGAKPYPKLLDRLRANPEVDIAGKSADELAKELSLDELTLPALATLKQLKSIGVRWSEAPSLIERGLESVQRVVDAGAKGFAARLDGVLPQERIDRIWRESQAHHGFSVGLMGMVQPILFGAPSPVMATRSNLPKEAKAVIDAHPTLAKLFRSLDQCQCDPCLSVLSPAAYLADLLKFIDASVDTSHNAGRVLQARRPDLYDLELSCENSNVELPHIDLVNEVLENAIALPIAVPLERNESPRALMQQGSFVSAAVRAALGSTASDVLAELKVEEQTSPAGAPYGESHWIVSDRFRRWTLTAQEEYLGLEPTDRRGADLRGVDLDVLFRLLDGASGQSVDVRLVPALLPTLREAFRAARMPLAIAGIRCRRKHVVGTSRAWVLEVKAEGTIRVVRGQRQNNLNLPGTIFLTATGGAPASAEFRSTYAEIEGVYAELSARRRFPAVVRGWFDPIPPRSSGSQDAVRTPRNAYQLEAGGTNPWQYSTSLDNLLLIYRAPSLVVTGLSYQSSDESKDLLATPQNRNPAAYERLGGPGAVFPWTLPYDDALQEIRGLLEQANLPRAGWLAALTPTQMRENALPIVQEMIGLSQRQYELISATATDAPLHRCWGLETSSDADIRQLLRVSELLERSRLSINELQDLLRSRIINPNGAYAVDMQDGCDIETMRIRPDTGDYAGLFDRLHRYTRLWRVLGWDIETLDAALGLARSSAPLSVDSLLSLAYVISVTRALRVPASTVVEWLLPTTTDNTTIRRRGALARALGLDDDEFFAAALVLKVATDSGHRVGDPLGSAGDLRRFVDEVQLANVRGQDWNVLAYVLLHDGPAVERLGLSRAHADHWLDAAYGQLAYPAQATAPVTDHEAEDVTSARWRRWGLHEEANGIWSVADPAGSANRLTNANPLSLLARMDVVAAQAAIEPATLRTFLEALATQLAGVSIAIDGSLPGLNAAHLDLIEQVADWYKTARPLQTLAALLAQELDTDTSVVEALLSQPLRPGNVPAADQELLRFLLGPPPVPSSADDRLHHCLLRAHKLVLLNNGWKADAARLRWLQELLPEGRFQGLDVLALPVLKNQTLANDQYFRWKQSTALMSLASTGTGMVAVLEAYRTAAADDTQSNVPTFPRWEVLAQAFRLVDETGRGKTGWVSVLANELTDSPGNRRDPLWLADLCAALALVQKVGAIEAAPVELLKALAKASPDDVSIRMARVLLDRLGAEAKKEALRTVESRLRESRRDRLVDYLLWRERDTVPDVNAMYAHFLIDTQMSACMNTTRVLQATAAGQLFVQRCLMNLEPAGAPPSCFDAARWEWVRNFRVWEANRKVFLYPENWLYPELRDDKTETFKSCEKALLQSEPSDENATKALAQYLDNLSDVAQVTVMGIHQHEEARSRYVNGRRTAEQTSILSLVGRSPTPPYSFYGRQATRWADAGMRWSGWERIDADLSGDHLLPFVFEGNLCVAWPTTREFDEGSKKFYQVQLEWIARTKTGWTRRQRTRTAIPEQGASGLQMFPGDDFRELIALRLKPSAASTSASVVEFELLAKTVIPQLPLTEATSTSPAVTAGDNTRSKLFWSLDVNLTDVKVNGFDKDQGLGANRVLVSVEPATPSSFTLTLVGVSDRMTMAEVIEERELFPPPGRLSKLSLLALLWDEMLLVEANYRNSISGQEQNRLDGLWVASMASVAAVVLFPPLAYNASFPELARRFGALLDTPVYEVTGVANDTVPLPSTSGLIFSAGRMMLDAAGASGRTVKVRVRRYDSAPIDVDIQFDPVIASGSRQSVAFSIAFRALVAAPVPPRQMSSVGSFRLTSGFSDDTVSVGRGAAPRRPGHVFFSSNLRLDSGVFPFVHSLSKENVLLDGGINHRRADHTRFAHADTLRLLMRTIVPDGNLLAAYPASFPEAADYRKRLSQGAGNVFDLSVQNKPNLDWFAARDVPDQLDDPAAGELLDRRSQLGFDLAMPHATYNWEVFYHLPMAAALFLSRQRRFEDARDWFQFVFDPTTADQNSSHERVWRCAPFRQRQHPDSVRQLLQTLAGGPAGRAGVSEIQDQISAWLCDPFNPFAVARLRPSAFEWFTVIAYVRNLIEWGDQLFRRETRESINEATQLYVLASEILGERPRIISHSREPRGAPRSYRSLNSRPQDDFTNAWVSLADSARGRELRDVIEELDREGRYSSDLELELADLSAVGSLYFCVPPNEKLGELWDAVEDRLFKIRHCQNVDGIRRELPLYELPIDPELLIRATAAGVSLEDVLSDRFAPLPHYRFQRLLQKANEFCSEVKNLGSALLSSLEKEESEHLMLLRSSQELDMLRLVERVKRDQVLEAQANLDVIRKTRANTLDRFAFLQRQLGKSEPRSDVTGAPIVDQGFVSNVAASGALDEVRSLGLTTSEVDQIIWLQAGHTWTVVSAAAKTGSSVAHLVGLYTPAKPWAEVTGHSLSALADGFGALASNAAFWGQRASLVAGWQRRHDEWVQQSKATAEDIRQIDKQIIALQIRQSIAKKELEHHGKQIEFASNVDDYMRHLKFTNQALYGWMESQLSTLYFGAYQMAVDLAKRAERALRHELGDPNTQFIRYGQWDSLRKGLLSGEQLGHDLRRMETAFMDRNRREVELTRHVSLRQLNPEQLLRLRAEGWCDFALPEWLFDLDFPGHYFRRIKTVGVSLPCVVGPYTSISGTLSLLRSGIRIKAQRAGVNGNDEPNKAVSHMPVQSIATSTAQNDSGVFDLTFRDERYLPFEGAGAESSWRFSLPTTFKAFDYGTISDLLLHVRYTAREGGEALRDAALRAVPLEGDFVHLLSLKQDFGRELAARSSGAPLTLKIEDHQLPYLCRTGFTLATASLLEGDAATLPAEIRINQRDRTVTLSGMQPLGAPFGLDGATDPHLLLHFQSPR